MKTGLVKQVIVIRKDLNMRKGKLVAQGSHASMAFLTKPLYEWGFGFKTLKYYWGLIRDVEFRLWLNGFTKICLYVESEDELLQLYTNLIEFSPRLKVYLIRDSGKTEFKGHPTYTCLAVGPNFNGYIDTITGGLKLL